MRKNIRMMQWVSIVCLLLLSACGGGSGSASSTGSAQAGKLSLGLTDATTTDYQAVYITIKKVLVLQSTKNEDAEHDWVVVAEPRATFNLLELVNGLIQNLGLTDLEAGRYDQIRLVLDDAPDASLNTKGDAHPYANYIIYGDSAESYQYFELTIPSGYQSGFKIVGGFTIESDQTTDLVLDFNVVKSIVQAGKSGKWLLKPTVKMMDHGKSSAITGIVSYHTEEGDLPLEGVIVSVQIGTADTSTEIVTSASITDESGAYTLLTDPGTYTVVAIMPGYKSASAEVVVTGDAAVEQNFLLEAAQGLGTIYGKVDIEKGLDDQSVRINVLEKTTDGAVVEVASATVANGGNYYFDLPVGTYSMTAIFTVNGKEMTMEAKEAFEIVAGDAIKFDILFEHHEGREDDDATSNGKSKVTVCHKGRSITISSSALQAHLNHGDVEGVCDGTGNDDGTAGEPSDGTVSGGGESDVTICHKGRRIEIHESTVNAHLGHGDSFSPCVEDQDGDDETDTREKPGTV